MNFSWKNHVSVLRISLNKSRFSENKIQGTQETNEQIATVLKMLFNKMQASFLKTNLFISFASKIFEKWFSITSILRPVCAIMQRSNLNKKKIFLFFEIFRILIEKNCKLESICCPVVKTALSVSKGTVWEGYLVFKNIVGISWAIFFGNCDQRFSTRLLILLFTSPVEFHSVFKFLRNVKERRLKT